ncbi:MAG: hypothetical protein ACRELW_21815 [Candidatus Rokuibacteriota bacterium]
MSRAGRLARALPAALFALCLAPDASAQVFIASKPHPEFWIAPLSITANISRRDMADQPGLLTLQMSFSVAPPPARDPAELAQDLFLLWPGELTGTAGADGADPALARQVEAAGFTVLAHGRVPLSALSRLQMGTGAGAAARRALGEGFFVTFARSEGLARGAKPASYVRIPWRPELASLDWLPRLELPVKGAIIPRRVSWLEETFWGRRYVITLGFGDVGYSSLYPLYYGNRDRVIPLAPDFSRLVINFANSNHLKVDAIVPTTASRRMSDTRENTETLSVPLVAADGIVPQTLKVDFVYFRGRLPWRPILLSALLLGLGNLTGPIVGNLVRSLVRTLRGRVHVGRGDAPGRARGQVPGPDVLAGIRPGETTYPDVLKLVGSEPEEEQRLPSGEIRAVVYRGERIVPHRGRRFGWFATVSHWEIEQTEVQIEFDRGRVRDIQTRIRRTRHSQPVAV